MFKKYFKNWSLWEFVFIWHFSMKKRKVIE